MANYTTTAGLLKRIDSDTLSQLSDDTGTTTPDYTTPAAAAIITQAISDASFIVDLYVIGHIDMTDATNQARMEPYTCSIALYNLHARRFVQHNQNPKAAQYDDAMRFLRGMAGGQLHPTATVPTRTVGRTRTGETRFFTDSNVNGFISND